MGGRGIFFFFQHLFIWLCRLFIATRGILAASVRIFPCGNSSVSALELLNCGSQAPEGVGSAMGRLSCSEACGIFVSPLGIKSVFPAL